MSRFLIAFIVAEVFLVSFKGVCGDEYAEFVTPEPIIEYCGSNMKCVEPHVCLNGQIATGGESLISVRSDCSVGKVCCRDTPEDSSEDTTQPIKEGCGHLNEGGINSLRRRIPDHAEFGEVPWMLALLQNDNSETYFGGASLIHPKIALTSAHIVDDKPANQIVVRAGEWLSRIQNESYPHQDRSVSDKVIHEEYDERHLFNDIALLFLRKAFEMMPHINTVCLPSPGLQQTGTACFATGWGVSAKSNNTDKISDYLKKINLNVVPNPTCQNLLRRTYLSVFFQLDNSFMCAGGVEGEDMCVQDGGSPLVCPILGKENRFQQVGVVSWGMEDGCGKKNVPGVYANVKRLRGWVDAKVTAKGLSTSTYTAA